jgi:hypothetical protein
MKNLLLVIALAAGLAAGYFGYQAYTTGSLFGSSDGALESPVNAVFTAEAEAGAYIDFQAMRETALLEAVLALPEVEQMQARMLEDQPLDSGTVDPSNILDIALCINGVESVMNQNPQGLTMAFAVRLSEPATVDDLVALDEAAAAEKGEPASAVETIGEDRFIVDEQGPGQPALYMTSVPFEEGSLIVGGTRDAAVASLKRHRQEASERPEKLLAALDKASSNRQGWFALTLPEGSREAWQSLLGQAGMLVEMFAPGATEPLGEFDALVLSAKADEQMNVQLGLNFTGAEAATAFAEAVNASQALARMRENPNTPSNLKSLSVATDDAFASLDLAFTEEQIKQAVRAQAAQAPGAAGQPPAQP